MAALIRGFVEAGGSIMTLTVADIEELRSLAIESGVKLIGCTMTMDVFGYTDDDFIDGVEYGGAAAFLSEARKANVTLFI